MIDFVGKRKWYFLVSGIIILIGVIFLLSVGLQRGIEFTGGTMVTIRFEQAVTQEELREELAVLGHDDAIIQWSGDAQAFVIRTTELSEEDVVVMQNALTEAFGTLTIVEVYAISGSIASDIEGNAMMAVIVAAIGILLYVTWAFRRLMRPFRYGVCAIVALLHDVIIVLGIFSILGVIFDMEIDAMFIVGVLTIIGYSVNDTIVVFDRIRENSIKSPGTPFATTVNNSIMETLGRSLNTVITTLFVILALLLLGGATIHNFALVLLIGVISGTYSSIFIASQLLVVWDSGAFGRLFRRVVPKRAPAGG
ncbi:MAG: protein translocase subunit SecF [Dehalococcoidia bacterium]|nr:protein translocase subunit SecF [Dehalococcoidia bacterium]